MNKFGILRKINNELTYHPITEHIGVEIPIDISKRGTDIFEEIKSIIEENLSVKIKSILKNNIKGTIAKYGLIDVNFEVELEVIPVSKSGIQILRANSWVDQENPEETTDEGLGFLEDMLTEISMNKTYLKVFATSIDQKEKWFKEKSYLLKQMLNGENIKPTPEDKIQVFKIKDMCYTNYSGIWLWKYFYM